MITNKNAIVECLDSAFFLVFDILSYTIRNIILYYWEYHFCVFKFNNKEERYSREPKEERYSRVP